MLPFDIIRVRIETLQRLVPRLRFYGYDHSGGLMWEKSYMTYKNQNTGYFPDMTFAFLSDPAVTHCKCTAAHIIAEITKFK